MPHEWILQVLADLQDYAIANDLPATAEVAAEALKVARAELAARREPPLSGSLPPAGGLH